MRGFRKVSILPVILDRSYSLKERLSVWFHGETYQSRCGETRLKPYAIFRKFNLNGYSIYDPYRDSNSKVNPIAERRFYEKGGVVFKTKMARKIYNDDRVAIKKVLYSIKQIREYNK